MGVVAAGVHDRRRQPLAGGAVDRAGEGQAGLLLHRQRVHVGAQQQHRAGPVLHDRDDAGAADPFGDREAQPPRLGRQQPGAARLLHAELGIGVQVAVERHQLGHVPRHRLVQPGGDVRLAAGGGERGGHGSGREQGGKQGAAHRFLI